MEEQTRQHIALAERNRLLATTLLNGVVQPVPSEWAAVIAFYAAVHFVNAYLFEQLRASPMSHGERNGYFWTDRRLATCRRPYRRLLDAAYQARYAVDFELSEQQARDLVEADLAAVETVVRNALSLPPAIQP